ncbi:MAG: glycosyltransferase family 39 protein [Planctomycetota bacterium]
MPSPAPERSRRRPHVLLVVILLGASALLASTSLLRDSCTFDETSHLTAGYTCLKTGDFRFAPDHPPLAKAWCALPLLAVQPRWPGPEHPGWQRADVFAFGRTWLFELNDGQRLLVAGRLMMVVLLVATCLVTYALARTLFGPNAGLLALALAALSPTLLAHGRLITTDIPITLLTGLVLLTFARLTEQITWPRLLAAALALGAASVTKFSWPLVLPALAVGAGIAIFRNQPLVVALALRARVHAPKDPSTGIALQSRAARTVAVAGAAVFVAIIVWALIWTCYGWRRDVLAPLSATATAAERAAQAQTATGIEIGWRNALYKPGGEPFPGVAHAVVRGLRAARLLPDAYLLGLSHTLSGARVRPGYLMGEWSLSGWPQYFPIAFALKTPLATVALLVAGISALARHKLRPRHDALFAGVLVFAAVYALSSVSTRLNIGHRHLLPLYPLVFAFAGAAVAWTGRRIGRIVLGGALAWLLATNLLTWPNYLAYFNELTPAARLLGSRLDEPHDYLADSNLDWGQDLIRLGEWAEANRAGEVKLAYFGSAFPAYYLKHTKCTALPSYQPFGPAAELTPGTYVVSATQLLGVYDLLIRAPTALLHTTPDSPWWPELARLSPAERRARWLVAALREHPPDERVGASLFVYRLSEQDVRELSREPTR